MGKRKSNNISITSFGEPISIEIKNIIYLQSDINYTRIFLNNNTTFLVAKSLKYYDTLLCAHNFIRIHRSFLVNRIYIANINSTNITLNNDKILPLSRRSKKWLCCMVNLKEL